MGWMVSETEQVSHVEAVRRPRPEMKDHPRGSGLLVGSEINTGKLRVGE